MVRPRYSALLPEEPPGGLLVIVNQGEAEQAAQRDMLQAAGLPVVAAFCHESLLFHYNLLRYVFVARR